MKLISWNVNGIRACVNKGFKDFFEEINAGLNSADPCIVGDVGNFRFTVIAYNFPCVFKGVH